MCACPVAVSFTSSGGAGRGDPGRSAACAGAMLA